ncbi:HAD-superfamily hydrolase, subfamily IA, variant 1 [Parvibaculum lavamentivorans DS-1]|uniref:HAD-superfamily hydrolase, subfamily IA, variant 1 n=1 Tax=Parvibaculum lavamentivorans (strain DS-1 / DSM 13023 / NCIMB 13966) TaxID=402881 RepID=A7HWU3_PARL1|nr:HAD family hydrolase [Parvibaculum lavamentivorans]ABS64376.1 HAD-superfamily hydrolase, subfamily IA, variant 1 [Parvibaculum lavamentivorans DS-1]
MAFPLRLVVFDCDGTLIDSQHMIVAAMAHAFETYGLENLPREKVLSIVGLSLDEAIHALVPDVEEPLRRRLTEAYKGAFHELRNRKELAEPLFPGVRETLEALAARENVLLGIATGKSQRGLRHALETHELGHYFVTLQTADDAPSKPHPEMLRRAMRAAGADARDTVLVGDTSYDMAMARAAGAHAFGVDWGYHAPEMLRVAGADIVLSDFSGLAPALDAIWTDSNVKETEPAGGA